LNALFERLRVLSAQIEVSKQSGAVTDPGVQVVIHPLTRRAAKTLPPDGLAISKFPFRIGRAASHEEENPHDMNDLWLIDEMPFNISRNHASIERDGDSVVLKDRGSSLGVYVNEEHVGGKSSTRKIALEEGDNAVVIGGCMSPYQFRITVLREPTNQ
jgi:pSer/pThr/pTyr-binding forkhead associated (FHA) protein